MSRRDFYLADRARVRRAKFTVNKGVVTNRNKNDLDVHYDIVGDWIPARLTPVKGDEIRNEAQFKLVYQYNIVLDRYDDSGNEVCLEQPDRLEFRVKRDLVMSDVIQNFKIVGAIKEHRKTSRVISYTVPVTLETEF
jgi:hypothetical protein